MREKHYGWCTGRNRPFKQCLACSTEECCFCLQEGRGWTTMEISQNAWVCSLCVGQEFEDIVLCYLKTQRLPLGMSIEEQARVKRVGKGYRWDTEMLMLMKAAGKWYGERIILEPLEWDAIILDLHKYGRPSGHQLSG